MTFRRLQLLWCANNSNWTEKIFNFSNHWGLFTMLQSRLIWFQGQNMAMWEIVVNIFTHQIVFCDFMNTMSHSTFIRNFEPLILIQNIFLFCIFFIFNHPSTAELKLPRLIFILTFIEPYAYLLLPSSLSNTTLQNRFGEQRAVWTLLLNNSFQAH